MPLPLIVLVAAVLVAIALPLLVFGLMPAGAVSDAKRMAAAHPRTVPVQRASGIVSAEPNDWIVKASPRWLVARLERDLALGGLTQRWPVGRVLRLQYLVLLVALLLGALFVAAGATPIRVLVAVVFVAIAAAAAPVIVAGRARERQDAIQHDLADALDQITISIEAGLGLESAVARAGQYGKGPLAEELTRTVQDMRVGFSRKEAYLALAARTSSSDLKRFARAIMQADAYGVPIGTVVRAQAKELRAKRRQRAEEKAMKIPVKVLFPLMFCILPVLFIVVLGPAVINLVHVFSTVNLGH
jgi:tight adherence protein C